MRNSRVMLVLAVAEAGLLCGCASTYDVKRVSEKTVEREGNIVFVRPKTNLPLQSLRRRLEVTYDSAQKNAAGLLEVKVGCRNKSGSDLVIYLKAAFYDQPYNAPGTQMAVPVYEANWQRVAIPRGATEQYQVVCPKKEGTHYQISISEFYE